jgi:hypothetical protein
MECIPELLEQVPARHFPAAKFGLTIGNRQA